MPKGKEPILIVGGGGWTNDSIKIEPVWGQINSFREKQNSPKRAQGKHFSSSHH